MEEQKKQTSEPEANKMAQSDAPEAQQTTKSMGSNDHKPLAIIGYILPVLFFVPLLTDAKNDPFAKFHANQHLVLLISWVVVQIVGTVIPLIGWFLILPIGSIFLIVVAIMGIINASKGETKEMPLIGGIKIIQ